MRVEVSSPIAERRHNLAATSAPTVNDDSGDGYGVGSKWVDTTNDLIWECTDASAGSALWRLVSQRTADELIAQRLGFLWQNWSRGPSGANSVWTSGTGAYCMAPFYPGRTYTGIALDCQTASGGSLTLAKGAVISVDDASVLAVSPSEHAAWNSGTGIKTFTFGTPYTTTVPVIHWLEVLFVGGTGPTVVRGQAVYDMSPYGAFAREIGRRTGQSDITAVGPNSSSGGPHAWMALIGS